MYYLNSRYFNPDLCRFINTDDSDILKIDTGDLLGYNLFAYCTNDPVNNQDDSGYWKLKNWPKIGIGIAAIGIGVAAAPALLGALQVAGTYTAFGAGMGVISGYIRGGRRGILKGAVDEACEGFMWGGISAGSLMGTQAALQKAGRCFKIGKNTEILYNTPNKPGGTIFSTKFKSGKKFMIDLDSMDGLHFHYAKGKSARIHRVIVPWFF